MARGAAVGASGTAFEVVAPQTPLELRGGQASAQFATVNRTGRPVRAAASVEPVGQTPARWFTLTPATIEMASGASGSFTVAIVVPTGSPHGQYSFQLLVAAQDNPDDDYAVSGLVTFEVVAEKPAPAPIPWLLIGGIAAGVLVVVAGVLVWLFTLGPLGPAAVGVTPSSLTLDNTFVGATSAEKKVTVGNTGHQDLHLSSVALGNKGTPFSIANDGCSGKTLGSGKSCTFGVVFAPTAPGSLSEKALITTDASGTPIGVGISGVGVARPIVKVPTTAVKVPVVGTTLVVVQNAGPGALHIKAVALRSDTNAFAVAKDACSGQTVPAGQSCEIFLTNQGLGTARAVGSLLISDDGEGSPQQVTLTG